MAGENGLAAAATKKPTGPTVIRPVAGDQALLEDVLELRSLYANNHLSDVLFVFPKDGRVAVCEYLPQISGATTTNEHRLLPAHRVVLALRSGAFQSALLRSKSSQVPGQVRFPIKILVEDTSFHVFSTLVRYLYCNEITIDPVDEANNGRDGAEQLERFWRDLLRAAYVYLVPSLVEICVGELTHVVRHSSLVGDVAADNTIQDRADLKHLRRVLDTLVFCDTVLATKPNATHRRTSTKLPNVGSLVENGSASGPSNSDGDAARGLGRCLAGLHQLQELCMHILDGISDTQFEALVKSESGLRCSTECLCVLLRRRSSAPLVVAIRYQLGRVVNELLRIGEPLDETNDEEKDLPLVAALMAGNEFITRRLLVEADAPYFLLTDKVPIIFLACMSGNLLHCHILIDHNAQDVNLISPLEDGDKEILADYGKRQTPLHIASKKGHAEIVELLLRNNAASNLPDEEGNTPLHRAGNVETATALLRSEFRTNADIPNRRGQTALHVAAASGDVGVVNLLIHHGADQGVLDDQGQNAFHVAAANGHTAVALILLHENEERELSLKQRVKEKTEGSGGSVASSLDSAVVDTSYDSVDDTARSISDVNMEDYKGNTALHLAAMSPSERCQKMLQLLLENGADPNRSNWFGYTPLHLFCSHHSGPAAIVDVFIEHGVNIHAQSLDGSTPLHLAVGRASEEVSVALVIAGAHVHLQDAAGRTVVDLAETSNQGVLLVPVLRNLSRAPEWVPDDQVQECSSCHAVFRVAMRKHHCRHCGRIVCYNCSSNKIAIPKFQLLKPSRVCDTCYDVLSFRRLL